MPIFNARIDPVPPPSTISIQSASDDLTSKKRRNHIRNRIVGGLWIFNLTMIPVIILLAVLIHLG